MSAEAAEPQALLDALDDGSVGDGALSTSAESIQLPSATGEGNKFQQAVAAWRNLDLTSLVSNLDTAASDLVNHQRDSLVQRKDLAQKTKDFRKLEDPAKLAEIKTLLKSYQTFIDLLTNQSKAVSSAFLSVYSPLSEAPDPYPLLEASIDSLVKSDEVVPKLELENEHLQASVAKLTSQLEATEGQLEVERTSRQSSEGAQDVKIKEIETSWSHVLKEKEDNWASREKSLEEKVESQDRLLKELKASYEVAQRLGKAEDDSAGDAGLGASQAELDLTISELERTSARLADIEARNEQLLLELAQSAARLGNPQKSGAVEDEPAFLRLRSENTALLRKLDSARHEKGSEQGRWESSLRGLEREMAGLKEDREVLRRKLDRMLDYNEVKQELVMLKSIEFATGDDDASDDEDAQNGHMINGTADKGKAESLEQLLGARNKKLGNELTVLRLSHQDVQSRLESLQEELSISNMELEKSRNLTAMLENDLQRAQSHAANAFDPSAMSVAGTYTSRYPKSAYASRRGGTSPTSSIISGFDGTLQGSPRTLEGLRAGEPLGGGSGILPMVTAQRDRFKKKIQEMETELSKSYQNVSALRSEVASLQKDNLTLYEKTRYVSSYARPQSTTSSSSAYAANPNSTSIHMSSDTSSGLSLDRYRSAYESNISPFAAFRGRESARAFKRMTLAERAIFQITRMVLATRTSRNLFAVYCLGLHLLVFGMLFWAGTADIEQHSSRLGESVAAAGAGLAAGGVSGDSSTDQWQQAGFKDTE